MVATGKLNNAVALLFVLLFALATSVFVDALTYSCSGGGGTVSLTSYVSQAETVSISVDEENCNVILSNVDVYAVVFTTEISRSNITINNLRCRSPIDDCVKFDLNIANDTKIELTNVARDVPATETATIFILIKFIGSVRYSTLKIDGASQHVSRGSGGLAVSRLVDFLDVLGFCSFISLSRLNATVVMPDEPVLNINSIQLVLVRLTQHVQHIAGEFALRNSIINAHIANNNGIAVHAIHLASGKILQNVTGGMIVENIEMPNLNLTSTGINPIVVDILLLGGPIADVGKLIVRNIDINSPKIHITGVTASNRNVQIGIADFANSAVTAVPTVLFENIAIKLQYLKARASAALYLHRSDSTITGVYNYTIRNVLFINTGLFKGETSADIRVFHTSSYLRVDANAPQATSGMFFDNVTVQMAQVNSSNSGKVDVALTDFEASTASRFSYSARNCQLLFAEGIGSDASLQVALLRHTCDNTDSTFFVFDNCRIAGIDASNNGAVKQISSSGGNSNVVFEARGTSENAVFLVKLSGKINDGSNKPYSLTIDNNSAIVGIELRAESAAATATILRFGDDKSPPAGSNFTIDGSTISVRLFCKLVATVAIAHTELSLAKIQHFIINNATIDIRQVQSINSLAAVTILRFGSSGDVQDFTRYQITNCTIANYGTETISWDVRAPQETIVQIFNNQATLRLGAEVLFADNKIDKIDVQSVGSLTPALALFFFGKALEFVTRGVWLERNTLTGSVYSSGTNPASTTAVHFASNLYNVEGAGVVIEDLTMNITARSTVNSARIHLIEVTGSMGLSGASGYFHGFAVIRPSFVATIFARVEMYASILNIADVIDFVGDISLTDFNYDVIGDIAGTTNSMYFASVLSQNMWRRLGGFVVNSSSSSSNGNSTTTGGSNIFSFSIGGSSTQAVHAAASLLRYSSTAAIVSDMPRGIQISGIRQATFNVTDVSNYVSVALARFDSMNVSDILVRNCSGIDFANVHSLTSNLHVGLLHFSQQVSNVTGSIELSSVSWRILSASANGGSVVSYGLYSAVGFDRVTWITMRDVALTRATINSISSTFYMYPGALLFNGPYNIFGGMVVDNVSASNIDAEAASYLQTAILVGNNVRGLGTSSSIAINVTRSGYQNISFLAKNQRTDIRVLYVAGPSTSAITGGINVASCFVNDANLTSLTQGAGVFILDVTQSSVATIARYNLIENAISAVRLSSVDKTEAAISRHAEYVTSSYFAGSNVVRDVGINTTNTVYGAQVYITSFAEAVTNVLTPNALIWRNNTIVNAHSSVDTVIFFVMTVNFPNVVSNVASIAVEDASVEALVPPLSGTPLTNLAVCIVALSAASTGNGALRIARTSMRIGTTTQGTAGVVTVSTYLYIATLYMLKKAASDAGFDSLVMQEVLIAGSASNLNSNCNITHAVFYDNINKISNLTFTDLAFDGTVGCTAKTAEQPANIVGVLFLNGLDNATSFIYSHSSNSMSSDNNKSLLSAKWVSGKHATAAVAFEAVSFRVSNGAASTTVTCLRNIGIFSVSGARLAIEHIENSAGVISVSSVAFYGKVSNIGHSSGVVSFLRNSVHVTKAVASQGPRLSLVGFAASVAFNDPDEPSTLPSFRTPRVYVNESIITVGVSNGTSDIPAAGVRSYVATVLAHYGFTDAERFVLDNSSVSVTGSWEGQFPLHSGFAARFLSTVRRVPYLDVNNVRATLTGTVTSTENGAELCGLVLADNPDGNVTLRLTDIIIDVRGDATTKKSLLLSGFYSPGILNIVKFASFQALRVAVTASSSAKLRSTTDQVIVAPVWIAGDINGATGSALATETFSVRDVTASVRSMSSGPASSCTMRAVWLDRTFRYFSRAEFIGNSILVGNITSLGAIQLHTVYFGGTISYIQSVLHFDRNSLQQMVLWTTSNGGSVVAPTLEPLLVVSSSETITAMIIRFVTLFTTSNRLEIFNSTLALNNATITNSTGNAFISVFVTNGVVTDITGGIEMRNSTVRVRVVSQGTGGVYICGVYASTLQRTNKLIVADIEVAIAVRSGALAAVWVFHPYTRLAEIDVVTLSGFAVATFDRAQQQQKQKQQVTQIVTVNSNNKHENDLYAQQDVTIALCLLATTESMNDTQHFIFRDSVVNITAASLASFVTVVGVSLGRGIQRVSESLTLRNMRFLGTMSSVTSTAVSGLVIGTMIENAGDIVVDWFATSGLVMTASAGSARVVALYLQPGLGPGSNRSTISVVNSNVHVSSMNVTTFVNVILLQSAVASVGNFTEWTVEDGVITVDYMKSTSTSHALAVMAVYVVAASGTLYDDVTSAVLPYRATISLDNFSATIRRAEAESGASSNSQVTFGGFGSFGTLSDFESVTASGVNLVLGNGSSHCGSVVARLAHVAAIALRALSNDIDAVIVNGSSSISIVGAAPNSVIAHLIWFSFNSDFFDVFDVGVADSAINATVCLSPNSVLAGSGDSLVEAAAVSAPRTVTGWKTVSVNRTSVEVRALGGDAGQPIFTAPQAASNEIALKLRLVRAECLPRSAYVKDSSLIAVDATKAIVSQLPRTWFHVHALDQLGVDTNPAGIDATILDTALRVQHIAAATASQSTVHCTGGNCSLASFAANSDVSGIWKLERNVLEISPLSHDASPALSLSSRGLVSLISAHNESFTSTLMRITLRHNTILGAGRIFAMLPSPSDAVNSAINTRQSKFYMYCNYWPRSLEEGFVKQATAGNTEVNRYCNTLSDTLSSTRTPLDTKSHSVSLTHSDSVATNSFPSPSHSHQLSESNTVPPTATNRPTRSATLRPTPTLSQPPTPTGGATKSHEHTASATMTISESRTVPLPRTMTRSKTRIPPTPAPVVKAIPNAEAIIESVGGISAIAAVASAPSIIRGLTVLSMVSDSCNSTPTLTNDQKVKSLPFPQTAAPLLWIGSRDDPRSPHRGAIVANIIVAPVVVMLLSISIWACFFAFQRYMFNRAQKQMLDGGNLPQQQQSSEANSVKQQLMPGVGDPLQPPPEFSLKQLCASSAVLGRVVQCYGFTIEGAMASAMFLWSFNTSPLAGEHSAPDAGDVVLAIFGAFMPIIVLVGLFWYAHSRVLSPKERPDNAAVFEAANMEIKGEFKESRFWRIALGYSTWRPPPEATAERFNYELCYPMFGKQRGMLPEHKGSRLQTWLAEASARSMINDILITGFLGACRGYALSDPCTRSEGALIFVLILALISLGETILLRSFGSPLRNVIDNLSAFALFAATGMAVSEKTKFIAAAAISTVVLGILSVFINRGLAITARVCFQIRMVPEALMSKNGSGNANNNNGNELVQLLNEAIFSSAPTRGVEVAPPAPVEMYVPPVVEPPPPPAPRAFEVTPVEQEMNVEMDDFGFLDLENDMNNNNNEQQEQEAAGGDEVGQFDLFDGLEGGGGNAAAGGEGGILDDEDIFAGLDFGESNNANGDNDDLALAADGSVVARRGKNGETVVDGETYQGAPTEAEARLKRLLDELDDDLPPPEPKEKPKEKVHFTSADELRALLMEALKK